MATRRRDASIAATTKSIINTRNGWMPCPAHMSACRVRMAASLGVGHDHDNDRVGVGGWEEPEEEESVAAGVGGA